MDGVVRFLFNKPYLALPFIVLWALCYVNAIGNGFVADDYDILVDNFAIKSLENLPQLFTSSYYPLFQENTHRPIVTFSYFIDFQLWQLNAKMYHLENILLHIIFVCLLYTVLWMTCERPEIPFIVALLYMVHPAHSEVVNAISFREDIFAGIFMALAAICFLKTEREKDWWILVWYLPVVIFFTLAMFSKENAAVFPLLLGLYKYFIKEKSKPSIWKCFLEPKIILLYLVIFFYLYISFVALTGGYKQNIPSEPLWNRMLHQVLVVGEYLFKLILPIKLSFHTASLTLDYWLFWRGLAALFAWCAFGFYFYYYGRKQRLAWFGFSFYLIALLPMSNVIPLLNQAAERYLYLPAFGIFIIFADGILNIVKELSQKQKIDYQNTLFILILIIGILLGGRTMLRNRIWENEIIFWQDALDQFPENARYMANLGASYLLFGDSNKARDIIERALERDDDQYMANSNMGLIYLQAGDLNLAVRYLKRSIEQFRSRSKTWQLLGTAQEGLGRLAKAERSYHQALRYDPYNYAAFLNLCGIYIDTERKEMVYNLLTAYRADFPSFQHVFGWCADAFKAKDLRQDEIFVLKKGLEAFSGYPAFVFGLSSTLVEVHEFDEAQRYIEIGMQLEPMNFWYHFLLCDIYLMKGQFEQAKAELEAGSYKAPNAPEIVEQFFKKAEEIERRRGGE